MRNADMPAMPFVEPNTECSVSTGLTKRESLIQYLATRVDFAPEFYTDEALTKKGLKIWARKVSMMADALLAEMEITK